MVPCQNLMTLDVPIPCGPDLARRQGEGDCENVKRPDTINILSQKVTPLSQLVA